MYKKINKTYIKRYILIAFLFHCAFFFSDTLGYRNWQTVLAGSVIAPLTSTSFGFTAITDGKLLTSFSENGSILWQKPMTTNEKGFAESFIGDFIYTANGKTLSLYNPSGNVLWSVQTDTTIIEKPHCGWDGRVFVKEKDYLCSYTLTGLRRFRISLSPSKISLLTMNDGSLLHIQKKEIDGKSTALRISPFGKIIEEITFTGTITAAYETEKGILLGFNSGTIALCSVISDTAETNWTLEAQNTHIKHLYSWDNLFIAFFNDGRAAAFSYEDLSLVWLSIPLFNNTQIKQCVSDGEYLLVLTDKNIVTLSKGGIAEKNIDISTYSGLNTTLTRGGLFVVCNEDWSIRAYRIQVLHNPSIENILPYPTKPLIESSIKSYHNAPTLLTSKDIGPLELDIYSRISVYMEELKKYYLIDKKERKAQFPSITIFSIINDIQIASLFGTAQCSLLWANLLDNEDDQSILRNVLTAINCCAYDEDGEILESIEKKLYVGKNGQEAMFYAYCDTVVEICRFMGRPALMKKGKDILVALLGSKYSVSVQNYARNSLEKIIELQL